MVTLSKTMNRRLLQKALGCSLLLGALACGGETIDDPAPLIIGSHPLAGFVANQPWTFVGGTSDPVLTTLGKETLILCSQALADPCAPCEGQHQVRIVVTPEADSYSVKEASLSVRFVSLLVEGSVMTSSQVTASAGKLFFSEVTDTVLRGGIAARYAQETGYDVAGLFEITRCPELVVPEEADESP
jgi:hypothetical protein